LHAGGITEIIPLEASFFGKEERNGWREPTVGGVVAKISKFEPQVPQKQGNN
jgi:hypothetical protein